MTNDQREIRRKLRVLEYADSIGDVSKTCRYFGVGRASFYRWRDAYQKYGEAGLSRGLPPERWSRLRVRVPAILGFEGARNGTEDLHTGADHRDVA